MLVMTGHAKKLSDLGIVIPNRLGINRVLQSLPPSYKNFVMNYNMQNMNKEFPELFGMLKAAEIEIKKEHQVLMVNKTTSFKKQGKSKGKFKKGGKKAATPPMKPKNGPKPDAECYYCKEKGHWKRNCSKYLADLKSGLVKKKKEGISDIHVIDVHFTGSRSSTWVFDTGSVAHICNSKQELKNKRQLLKDEVTMRVGNGSKSSAVPENVPVPPTPTTEEANDNDHETSNETATEPRRSTRDRATPDWYDPCLNVMIVDNNDEDPATYEEAMMSPDSNKWQEAMKSEMGSMYDNKVWTLVDLPDSRKAVENKWIFKRKTDADDYFTKWVEAVPMKKVKSEDVIKFVKEHVIHRFGIPQTITTDGGSVFISKEFRKFCDDLGIKLIRSSPYYAQANGQAEAPNQSLIKLIKRKIDENPRDWHEKLSEALWAYRMSCHGAIKTSPYQLVYGQEAVLPWEITAGSRRVTFQNDLTAEEYAALMSDTIEDATELRLWSLEKIKENKARVARAYNKKVRPKEFRVGDLVWEAVLPLGTRDKAYGKWSPNWHGPYKVVQALKGNAYMLEQLDGAKFPVAVNGQHLKKYFPSMWDDGQ
ncbi:hypothetical protein QYE76_028836 [Lolium multiflorum]|uniref:Uncharacterized protein n=1 Tax=Lolium multiflorum TaxID=4521 RepID=A0AAD8VHP6_LOLMU|nr:hypothetical protein QYE76_028836 [Lolium multiflorum]